MSATRPTPRRRTLVTGGAGFVGQHVIAALHQRGEPVVALEHRRKLPGDVAAKCCEVITGDLLQKHAARRATEMVDRVCHLAAYIPRDLNDADEAETCYRVNALATLQLARAAVASGVERFVYVSAANAYVPGDRPAREEDAMFPSTAAPYYLASKLAGEIYLHHVCGQSATCGITLRVGTPYGPGEPSEKVIPTLLARARRGEPLPLRQGGRAAYNFVYVEDVARCVAAALESGESGVYNIASGESTTLLSLAETIADLYAERSPPIVLEPVDDDRVQGFRAVSVDKARRTWAFAPLTLREGLRQYGRTEFVPFSHNQ